MSEVLDVVKMDVYGRRLASIMSDLDRDMTKLDERSEEYKDRQYIHALIDLVHGSTALNGEGYEVRNDDLLSVKSFINDLEVME